MPAILQQFQYEVVNNHDAVQWPFPRVGEVLGAPIVGYADDGAKAIDRVVCRSISWHIDSHFDGLDSEGLNSFVILQVVQGDGFFVQDWRQLKNPQPVGTVIVLDDSKSHRLLAPGPKYDRLWAAQYTYAPKTLYTAIADDQHAIASLLKVNKS